MAYFSTNSLMLSSTFMISSIPLLLTLWASRTLKSFWNWSIEFIELVYTFLRVISVHNQDHLWAWSFLSEVDEVEEGGLCEFFDVKITKPYVESAGLFILHAREAPVGFGSIKTYSGIDFKELNFSLVDLEQLLEFSTLVCKNIYNSGEFTEWGDSFVSRSGVVRGHVCSFRRSQLGQLFLLDKRGTDLALILIPDVCLTKNKWELLSTKLVIFKVIGWL